MKFSQRIGKIPVRDSLQIDSIDKSLENRLWNEIYVSFLEHCQTNTVIKKPI